MKNRLKIIRNDSLENKRWNSNNTAYSSYLSRASRSILYLKSNIKIKLGNETIDNPYELTL